MKIKKVDDKPMVIHTKEKAKIHAHEPKGAKIKGSNIYTVERGPKVHDAKANEMDKKASAKLMLQKSAGGKRTYRKSTIHQSEAKDKGLSRFKRNIRESGTSIKTKNTNLHIAGRTGALAAGAVTEQVEGGQEISQAAYLAYESSRPVTGTASKGAALFRKKAAAEARKRIKKVEAGKKLAKRTAKKAAKDTAKTVAKETAKETAKTTAKVATKTATKAAATAAGTAVAPGVGTAIGMAAGYAAGVSIEVKDEKMTNRSRKIKFFLDKMRAQENQTDSVAKLVKDLIVRKAITWVKAAAPIIGLVLLLLVLVVAMIAVPVIAVIAILYNSPFALFLPPLESGDTVQTVTSAYVQEFNGDVNALYCKDASKKVRAAKAVLAKQGKYIAAFAPFGYQKSEDDKHMLVPDPVTAPVVQLIFELAIKGMKYTEIANYLNNNGYDSIFEYYQKIGVKRCYERDIGEHMWSASTVMEILYNEVYIGSVINNKTADNIDTGHQVVQRDKEDWIIVENCHEPLVSVEDFKLAHKMIARREVTKRKPNGKWRKSYIRCGICGKGLYKYGNKSSYRCHNGHVSRIRGEELEATLLDIARNMALAQLQEFELKTDGGNCPDNLEREIESLKKSKAHYAKLKFEIYDDYTKTNITRDQMAKKTAEVKQKIAEIESLITEKQETLDMQKDLFLDAKQEQLTKLSKLDEFDEEVIRYLIDYVLVYDNEHIEIRWNFDDFQAG